MSKIATYLNEHVTGEVITEGSDVARAATDGGVLLERPELVAHTASTSDIRKITRFCWQLAEKGHVLTITPRGDGTNEMSAAIGAGLVLSQGTYMNQVVGIDVKQRLIHVQAGASYHGVNMALSTQRGLTLPRDIYGELSGSIGGIIASGAAGSLTGRYGTVGQSVEQLEVVLASGEVLQTHRLTKRELGAKKGLQTLEGEIYRQLDNLITDNAELLRSMSTRAAHDTSGYGAITKVRHTDGSFDLTPLFVGSQGTLGIISEVILKAQFARREFATVFASYKSFEQAREAADAAAKTKAVVVELIDGRMLARATAQGKKREFAPKECFKGALLVVLYDDFGDKIREKSAKKLMRELEKTGAAIHVTYAAQTEPELAELSGVLSIAARSTVANEVAPGVFKGMWLPAVKLDSFLADIHKLETSYGVPLPYKADVRNGFIDFFPVFDMKKVSDRQNFLKLLTDVAKLIDTYDGSLSGRGGDGRIKTALSQSLMSDEEAELYAQIKKTFDPYNILNPGVKQPLATKDLVTQLNAWCRTLG